MRTIANLTTAGGGAGAAAGRYLETRVLDALLREDVRACVSRATVRAAADLPPACAPYARQAGTWLEVAHLGGARAWIPVQATRFMQDWRSAGLPWLREEEGGAIQPLACLDEVLDWFATGLAPSAGALFAAFRTECAIAQEHRTLCERERERWFGQWRAQGDIGCGGDLPDWSARLLHYDRLAAFLDHPFYPTARAKLGFDGAALAAYSPEFAPRFPLRWLALPKTLYHASGAPGDWPPFWPRMEDVGLPAALAHSHALLPVHPFFWDAGLQAMLVDAGLDGQVLRAPRAWLEVAPTLSVRSVVVLDAPEWHVKLPLTIRTLGARNIRTIKPSTIGDGHRIQSLLGAIAAREPAIASRLLLTDEQRGAHADGRSFLGYILRRYPAAQLQDSTAIPVAALGAETPGGALVMEEVAARFYAGDLDAFFDDYLELTLQLHLLLWLRYGVALESNQQNSMLVLSHTEPRLRLLLKDNDAARIDLAALKRRWPQLAAHLDGLEDRRIAVTDPLALAQMFTTITLQLNIAAVIERMPAHPKASPGARYALVRAKIAALLERFAQEGEDVAPARRVLLEEERLYHKCLLVAATLAGKEQTGALDVNKFYGRGAPNFLGAA